MMISKAQSRKYTLLLQGNEDTHMADLLSFGSDIIIAYRGGERYIYFSVDDVRIVPGDIPSYFLKKILKIREVKHPCSFFFISGFCYNNWKEI